MRKTNFLGIEVNVIDEEEQRNAPEGTVYMMIRVEDSDPGGGSPDLKRRRTKTLCDRCRAVCWFDPKSFGSTPAHVQRLCMQCVLNRAKQEQVGTIQVRTIQAQMLPEVH